MNDRARLVPAIDPHRRTLAGRGASQSRRPPPSLDLDVTRRPDALVPALWLLNGCRPPSAVTSVEPDLEAVPPVLVKRFAIFAAPSLSGLGPGRKRSASLAGDRRRRQDGPDR